ncbi:MAG: carboxylesterase family protein, partial [Acidimicrobiales bacterium]
RTPFLDHPGAEARGVAFADALGITGPDQLTRLREVPPDELYDLVRAATRLGDHYPTIDGHVIPTSPFAAFANRQQADVPFVIGSNANEGTLIQPLFDAPMVEYRYRPVPDDAVPVEMQQAFGDDLARLLPHYPGLDVGEPGAQIDFLGDHMFGAPAHWYARHHATAGHPTWLYHFARTPPSKKQTVGAFHAAELTFVHGSSVPILPMSDDDKALGATMRQHWTAMARSGNPNEGADTGGPKWPDYTPTDPQWIRFDHTVDVEPVTKLEVYGVLDARLERVLRDMESAS